MTEHLESLKSMLAEGRTTAQRIEEDLPHAIRTQAFILSHHSPCAWEGLYWHHKGDPDLTHPLFVLMKLAEITVILEGLINEAEAAGRPVTVPKLAKVRREAA